MIGPKSSVRRILRHVTRTSFPARLAVLAAGAVSVALMAAVPASADPTTDAVIDQLGTAGAGVVDPGQAADFGRSMCPMLADPGQQMADTASTVADAGGMSLPGSGFAGLAISALCPSVMSGLANGESPIPLGLLGSLGG